MAKARAAARGLRARLAHSRNAGAVRSRLIFSAISALPSLEAGEPNHNQLASGKQSQERRSPVLFP
jgi:hypothetical protein